MMFSVFNILLINRDKYINVKIVNDEKEFCLKTKTFGPEAWRLSEDPHVAELVMTSKPNTV